MKNTLTEMKTISLRKSTVEEEKQRIKLEICKSKWQKTIRRAKSKKNPPLPK